MDKTVEIKRRHVLRWQQSGLSMREYCRKNQLSYWTFVGWKNKETQNTPVKMNTHLVQIPSGLFSHQTEEPAIEITLKNGIRIAFKGKTDSKYIREIILSLEDLS